MNRLPYLLVALLTAVPPLGAQTRWTLVWNDDFDGPANLAPDQSKWTYDLGAGGWGNHELELYTDLRENSYLNGKEQPRDPRAADHVWGLHISPAEDAR